MNLDLIVRKRVGLICRAFPSSYVDRDGVNVSIGCLNKKCKTHGNNSKKKLCLRVDSEIFHCWVCGMSGKGLARFFKIYKPNYYPEAKSVFEKQIKQKDEEQEVVVSLPQGFQLLGALKKRSDPDLKAALNYLRSRGISDHDIWRFRLGATSIGSYRRRVIMPSFDTDGELSFFTARTIDSKNTRKYMNPKLQRGKIVFNEFFIDWKSELTIVEGPFDLLKANNNCTALLGSTLAIKDELFQNIVKNKTRVILALDNDAIEKRNRIADLLVSYDIDVYYIKLGEFNDVGEMSKEQFSLSLKNKIQWRKTDKLMSMINSIKSGSLV